MNRNGFFDQFTLPVKGLHIGLHEYQFDINDDFFKLSDTELIESGNFKVNLVIDKNMDMMILNIDFEDSGRLFATDALPTLIFLSQEIMRY